MNAFNFNTLLNFLTSNLIVSKEYPAKVFDGDSERLGFAVFVQERDPPELDDFNPEAPGAYIVLAVAPGNGGEMKNWKDLLNYIKQKGDEIKQEYGEEEINRRIDELMGRAAELLATGGDIGLNAVIDLLISALEMFQGVNAVKAGGRVKVKLNPKDTKAYVFKPAVIIEMGDIEVGVAGVNAQGKKRVRMLEGSLADKFADRFTIIA